jgi:acyl-CoA synthetase (NDP forming)
MTVDAGRVRAVLESARDRGAATLVEPDGYALLDALGVARPAAITVTSADAVASVDPSTLGTERVVVKIASTTLLHRSDAGGVAVVANSREAIAASIRDMARRLPADGLEGFTINAFVAHDATIGGELLVGLRWTEDFGPVVTVGPGGIYTEFLSRHFRPGADIAILPVEGLDERGVDERLRELPVVQLAAGGVRGQQPRIRVDDLAQVVGAFMALGRVSMPDLLSECEVNPLVATPRGLVALDVLARLGSPRPPGWPDRPLHKLRNLLRPSRAAIIGVSESMNPGHVILDNLLREGFPPGDILVVKPGRDRFGECPAVADVASIPGTVDLLVLAISAAQVPATVEAIVSGRKAESVIVIPGGLEEKAGTRETLRPMYDTLRASRDTAWQGPVVNGGNCLGIRSLPGRYDTMFIPLYKQPARTPRVSPVALVSQSGAFAVAKGAKLAHLNPRYVITVGNQMDLTVSDYLSHLVDDDEVRTFAVYVEGFRPLDGRRFLDAARRIIASGRHVVLYRAGRTAAGAAASASHTASIAGDYAVTRDLAHTAGVVVAESLEDFEDLVTLFAALDGRRPVGRRLGAVSNAGFECVAIADSLGALELATFSDATRRGLGDLLRAARLDTLVDVHNPIDLTPMANDATYEAAARLVLEDEGVDLGMVGCVPLTPALNTLPPSDAHGEDLARENAVAARLVRLFADVQKPWVAVVDGGPLYEPLVARLTTAGVPAFRTADRALRLLNIFSAAAQRNATGDRAPGATSPVAAIESR